MERLLNVLAFASVVLFLIVLRGLRRSPFIRPRKILRLTNSIFSSRASNLLFPRPPTT